MNPTLKLDKLIAPPIPSPAPVFEDSSNASTPATGLLHPDDALVPAMVVFVGIVVIMVLEFLVEFYRFGW